MSDVYALRALEGSPGLSPAWLSFRIALAKAWEGLVFSQMPPAQQEEASGLLRAKELRFDAASAKRLLTELGDAVGLVGSGSAEWNKLLAAVAAEDDSVEKSIDASGGQASSRQSEGFAAGESSVPGSERTTIVSRLLLMVMPDGGEEACAGLASELGISKDSLWLTGRMLATPFAREAVARCRTPVIEAEGPEGSCPHCASVPELAIILGQEGRRYLMCTMCETRWSYARFRCPACQHCDPAGIKWVHPEGCQHMRLEVCLACGFPIRTFEIREAMETLRAFVLDTQSLPLLFLQRS